MQFDQLREVIHSRRSVRNFTDQDVSLQDVKDMIDCARYAPSDTNSQTWEFIAIMNRSKIKEIEQITWEQLHHMAKVAEDNGLAREAKFLVKSFGPYATAFADAPVLIVCLATAYTSKFRDRIFDPIGFGNETIWNEEGIKSSSLAIQNMMLAAHAKGLATCPMTGPVLLAEKQLRDYLDIPNDRQLNMVIALGHPKVQPKAIARKEIDEILRIVE